MRLTALLFLAISGPLAAGEPLPDPGQGQPADIQRFVERKSRCDHWGGEEPYDQARAKEIARAVRKLQCDSLASDEVRLRAKYKRQPAALLAIEAAGP